MVEGSGLPRTAALPVVDRRPRRQILEIQAENFARSVDLARRHPGIDEAYPELALVRTPADLPRLPRLTASRVSELVTPDRYRTLWAKMRPGAAIRSAGSTGRRKTLYHSWSFYRQVMRLGARGLLAGCPEPPQRIANCFLAGDLRGAFLFGHGVAEELGALTFPLGLPPDGRELAEIIAEAEVDALFASPSVAHRFLVDGSLNVGQLSSVAALYYLGEPFPASRREDLASRLPWLALRSLAYTSTETGPVGYQCLEQTGEDHHVHEDLVIVEILDTDSGAPVQEGMPGEVVVTTLLNDGVPIFRYRMGDLARWLPGPCPCGRNTRSLRLQGRLSSSLKLGGTILTAELLVALLGPFARHPPAPTDFQVVVNRAGRRFGIDLLLDERNFAAELCPTIQAACLRSYSFAHYLVPSSDFVGLQVSAVPVQAFAVSAAGKTPTFLDP